MKTSSRAGFSTMDSTSRAIPELTKKTGMKNPYSTASSFSSISLPSSAAMGQLEVRFPGAARLRLHPDLDGAIYRTPGAQDLQPAHRPLRTGRHHLEHLLDWLLERAWTLVPAQTYVAQMAQSLIEFPPSQSPASFTINQVMATLQAGMTSA